MKPILATINHNIVTINSADVDLYHSMYAEYLSRGLGDDDSRLFANILFLLTNKSMVDHLLKLLDAEVEQLWREEAGSVGSVLTLHHPARYQTYFGLSWPVPTAKLAENHSHHLLSRVLLQTEQRNNINVTYARSTPVPTFLGVITHEDATQVLLKNKRLWNDDPRLSGIFFHGKMMHRIQFNMIMRAVDIGLLDVGTLTILDIIKKFVHTKVDAYSPFYDNPWNFLLDFNISDVHFTEQDRRNLAPLSAYFPPTIDANKYDKPYVFGCDPYFLHSYAPGHLPQPA